MCRLWGQVLEALYNIGQAVGGEVDLMVLIGGAEEWAAIQWEKYMKFNLPPTAIDVSRKVLMNVLYLKF
jgi:hypothetical protein